MPVAMLAVGPHAVLQEMIMTQAKYGEHNLVAYSNPRELPEINPRYCKTNPENKNKLALFLFT